MFRMPSLMNIYNSGAKGYGVSSPFAGGDVAPGGGFAHPRILPTLPTGIPSPITPPENKYGLPAPVMGGGDVAPGGGFVNPGIIPPNKGYGLPGTGLGGGDVAPGGGFTNPWVPSQNKGYGLPNPSSGYVPLNSGLLGVMNRFRGFS